MQVINVHDAKTNFSKLLSRVERGELIIIGRAGRPIAQLKPLSGNQSVRRRFKGGGLRLQEQASKPLTPEYLNEIAASKYDG